MLELMNTTLLEVNARRRVEVLTETMQASRRSPIRATKRYDAPAEPRSGHLAPEARST